MPDGCKRGGMKYKEKWRIFIAVIIFCEKALCEIHWRNKSDIVVFINCVLLFKFLLYLILSTKDNVGRLRHFIFSHFILLSILKVLLQVIANDKRITLCLSNVGESPFVYKFSFIHCLNIILSFCNHSLALRLSLLEV